MCRESMGSCSNSASTLLSEHSSRKEQPALATDGPRHRLPAIADGAKPWQSHNQNPGHRSETLYPTHRREHLGMDARFPRSPGVHDAIECPAILCTIPARQPHPQSKKRFASPVPRRSLAGAIGTSYAPRPTHKAGDPEIRKDSGKVTGGFSCRSLFWEQSEQFPVFRLRQEAIEFPQHGLF